MSSGSSFGGMSAWAPVGGIAASINAPVHARMRKVEANMVGSSLSDALRVVRPKRTPGKQTPRECLIAKIQS
jgi:hypothetical protein